MVIWARCKEVLDEVVSGNVGEIPWKILQWSNISMNVAVGFLNFLYSGVLQLDLNSFEEWEQAKSIGQKYKMDVWNNFVESLKDCIHQPL